MMNLRERFGLISVLAVAVLLAAGGAVTAYQELGVFQTGGISPDTRFDALSKDLYRPAASTLSKNVVLETCSNAILSVYGRLQLPDIRRPVLENCRRQADEIAATAPSLSFAWYVGALASAQLDDAAGFNSRLVRSQITGPTEQWLAELRAALVEDHFGAASPELLMRHTADLRLLVGSGRGIASISSRYVREPGFRERITAIVETMPEADQARFVARVRNSAAAP